MALILEGSQPLLPAAAAAALPTASAAGELPVSDGAGSAYTATTAGDVLALGMVAALTGEPAGAALISDGAGDIATTSADVSAMLAASTAAGMLAILHPSTPISLASTSGWTTSASAGCTATIDTGDEQVELALPASAGTFTHAYAVRTPPAVGSWEFRARLRGHSGGTNVGDVAQLIVYGPGGTLYAGVNVRGDDTIIMVCDVTPPAASAAASLRAGQGWVRVVCDGGTVRGYWGIGSAGDPPTSWTALGAAVRPSATAPYSFELRLSANRGATIVGDLAVTWGDLSYRSLDL